MVARMKGGRAGEKNRGTRNENGEKNGRKEGQILLNILPATLPSNHLPATLGSVQAFRKGGTACTRVTHQVLLHKDLGAQ